MVPAGEITEGTVRELGGILGNGDVIVDGGNSNWHDSQRRAEQVAAGRHPVPRLRYERRGVGLANGYCLMVGGERGRRRRRTGVPGARSR